MSICDTPTTTGTLDVKPQIGSTTPQLKSTVTPSSVGSVGTDVKPLISMHLTIDLSIKAWFYF